MIPGHELDIVYQDDALVVVNKPGGLLAVPGRGAENQDCVVGRLKQYFPHGIEQPAVHRLDMDTSGLQVLALTRQAHRSLSRQFEQREVRKIYVALLDGVIEQPGGIIELPFRLDVNDRPRQVYDPAHGKMGVTRWKNLGVEGGLTRIEFTPLTGRTHQLRLHSAHPLGLGTPIVGDRLYGNGVSPGELKLHAARISFRHPRTGVPVTFESNTPF
ncbi:MAG: RluA family pseudouridine synthase [Spartobacteria bacterium]|nr:RluA family pseudouridine synthase [Spartobacteria bacterium]